MHHEWLRRVNDSINFWADQRESKAMIKDPSAPGSTSAHSLMDTPGRTGGNFEITVKFEAPFVETVGKFMQRDLDHHFDSKIKDTEIPVRSKSYMSYIHKICLPMRVITFTAVNDVRLFIHPTLPVAIVDSVPPPDAQPHLKLTTVIVATSNTTCAACFCGQVYFDLVLPKFLVDFCLTRFMPGLVRRLIALQETHRHPDYVNAANRDAQGTFALLRHNFDRWDAEGKLRGYQYPRFPTRSELLNVISTPLLKNAPQAPLVTLENVRSFDLTCEPGPLPEKLGKRRCFRRALSKTRITLQFCTCLN